MNGELEDFEPQYLSWQSSQVCAYSRRCCFSKWQLRGQTAHLPLQRRSHFLRPLATPPPCTMSLLQRPPCPMTTRMRNWLCYGIRSGQFRPDPSRPRYRQLLSPLHIPDPEFFIPRYEWYTILRFKTPESNILRFPVTTPPSIMQSCQMILFGV